MESRQFNSNRGVLKPNLSLYSRWLCGKYSFISMALAAVILWLIPWDYLYYLEWYKKLIVFVSYIAPSIEEIPDTENQFPEYSISLIAFLGLVGPFVAVYSFFYGIKHVERVYSQLSQELPLSVLLKGILLFLLLLPLFFWGAYNFTGSTFYTPGLFFRSKFHFVCMMLGCWWGVSSALFILSSSLSWIIRRSMKLNS